MNEHYDNQNPNEPERDQQGRVIFSTAAKVVLIIGASLTGLGLLSELFSLTTGAMFGIEISIMVLMFSMILGAAYLACELWLLIKRTRLPYFLMIGLSAIYVVYMAFYLFDILGDDFIREMYAMSPELGLAFTETLVTGIIVFAIVFSVIFYTGYLLLIFLLIKKQWKHMTMT